MMMGRYMSIFLLLLCVTRDSLSSAIVQDENEKGATTTATDEDMWKLWSHNSAGLFNTQPEFYANTRDPVFQNRFRLSGTSTRSSTRGTTTHKQYHADDDISESIKEIVKESMDVFGLTGVSIGVIEKDKVVFSDGFGYANKEQGTRATDQTHYHIASMTKAFTSMLLATYADDPSVKLDMDVPVHSNGVYFDKKGQRSSPLFPEWKMGDDEATLGTTLRDMLNHRTGLPRHDFVGFNLAHSKEDLLHRLAGLESDRPFRTAPGEYNNLMFALAGLAAERLDASKTSAQDEAGSSMPLWADLVKLKVFDVLNMTDTFASLETFGDRKTLARGYYQGTPVPEDNNRLHHVTTPAGGVISNINDMLKWAQLHLRQWNRLFKKSKSYGPYLVSDTLYWETFGQSQTVFPLYTKLDTYSNGWWHVPQHGTGNFLMTHGGNLNGFSTSIGLLPSAIDEVGSSAVIVLTNEHLSPGRDALLMKLTDLLQERAGYTVPATTKVDWDQLFFQDQQDYYARAAAENKEIEKKIANTPAAGKTPLFDLDAYVGSYVDVNGSYGRIDISEKNKFIRKGVLYVTVDDAPWQEGGVISFALGHMYFESFRVCDPKHTSYCHNTLRFAFENDGYGRVTSLEVHGLEPAVVLKFNKVASSSEESSSSY